VTIGLSLRASEIAETGPEVGVAGRIFFYVGMRKTGTRWFIYEFFPRLAGVRLLRVPRSTRLEDMADELRSDLPTVVVCHETWIGNLSTSQSPDGGRRLAETLACIAKVAPDAGIIVGFRENVAWLNSSYAQMAKKKAGLDAGSFADSYSREELSWSLTLRKIEASFGSVFPFLYDELNQAPASLIADLCRFIGVAVPNQAAELAGIRKNRSPRTRAGQFAMRHMNRLSRVFGRSAGLEKGRMFAFSERLGLWLDGFFPDRHVTVGPELAGAMRDDWNSLVGLVGERRGRDFSHLLPAAGAPSRGIVSAPPPLARAS
jgi:hypothetical protein